MMRDELRDTGALFLLSYLSRVALFDLIFIGPATLQEKICSGVGTVEIGAAIELLVAFDVEFKLYVGVAQKPKGFSSIAVGFSPMSYS